MVKLEHLNLIVKDMDKTLSFYQAAFPHWKVRGEGVGEWYGTGRRWLHFGDDYTYLTFNNNGRGINRNLQSNDMGLAHFAFVTDNIDAVINRLQKSGYSVDKAGANARFRKNCYFIDPNGYEVEFVEYLSDLPNERNLYENN
ncbi:VOC family protein [Alteromonas sp. ASW11-130]|uniref:VOC family protein n=1 Tax=Alteromonas sp. ASW11-130 TaxID=3015775 RepID=UPI00224288E6|nr:VOC family protein [Alteromonas sp. ASW11-130]MCW8092024.1 VOC family protein [Alteromonas sp. ASW11-130]